MQAYTKYHHFSLYSPWEITRTKCGPGRPKQLTEKDYRDWKLSAIKPHDRNMWRSHVRSAMCAASQLSGKGPTDVDVAPVPAC